MSGPLWYLYGCQVLGSSLQPWNRQVYLHFVTQEGTTVSTTLQDYQATILIHAVNEDLSPFGLETEDELHTIFASYVQWLTPDESSPVQEITVERRVPVIGFCNNQAHAVFRLRLEHVFQRGKTIRAIETYNKNRDPQLPKLVVLHREVKDTMAVLYHNQWRLHSWYQLPEQCVDHISEKRLIRTSQLTLREDLSDVGPCRIGFLRLSAHSSTATRTNRFQPDASIAADRVTSVHLSVFVRHQLLHRVVMDDADEVTLLLRVQEWIQAQRPSVLVHMSDPYDQLTYLHRRMKTHGLHLSTMTGFRCVENGQMHMNKIQLRDVTLPGCEAVDLRHVLQKFMITPNLDGYTLADVVTHPKLLRDPAVQHPSCPAEELAVLEMLERDNNFVLNNMALSRSCDLSLQQIVSRGQQTRVFSCFMRTYYTNGLYFNHSMVTRPFLVVRRPRVDSHFPDPPWVDNPPLCSLRQGKQHTATLPPTPRPAKRTKTLFGTYVETPVPNPKKKPTKRYGGGFVIRPEAGYYHRPEHAVATLDFASLYPSIMCGYQICFMRVCYDPKWLDDPRATKQYIPLDDDTCCVFISEYDHQPVRSITNVLVRDVMTNRTRIRAQMKSVTDSFHRQSLDAQQLCCKVLQNAVYGACGSETFPIRCTALAASVCTIGQWMNKTVRHLAMVRGCICVYGDTDSVMVQFPTDPALTTRDDILTSIYEQAHELEKEATASFNAPNAVEFEAIKLPFLMTDRKKTYAAYEFPPKPRGWTLDPTLLIKGFAIKKRDRCTMVQQIGLNLTQQILNGNLEDVLPWFRTQIILDTRPRTMSALQPFIISCRLNDTYKQPNVVGPVLADLYETEQGVRPCPGNRLKYVVALFPEEPGRKHFQCTMTPSGFLKSKRSLNMSYYLQKQLMQSLKQVTNQHPGLAQQLQTCIQQELTRLSHKQQRIQTITSFLTKRTNCAP